MKLVCEKAEAFFSQEELLLCALGSLSASLLDRSRWEAIGPVHWTLGPRSLKGKGKAYYFRN